MIETQWTPDIELKNENEVIPFDYATYLRSEEIVCDKKELEISSKNLPNQILCFAPNRITTVKFTPDADLEKEVKEFKEYIFSKGWNEYVQIGRFDDERNIFDFKINTLYIGLLDAIHIAIYFIDKGIQIDEERSEPYAMKWLKEILSEQEDQR